MNTPAERWNGKTQYLHFSTQPFAVKTMGCQKETMTNKAESRAGVAGSNPAGGAKRRHRLYCPRCVKVQYDAGEIAFCQECALETIKVERVISEIYRLNPHVRHIEPDEFIRRLWEKYCNGHRENCRSVPKTRQGDREPLHAIRGDGEAIF